MKKEPHIDLEALMSGQDLDLSGFGHEDFVAARTIRPSSPRWYWRNRLVMNDLNILAGTQGIGKSQVSMAIAAEATRRGEVVLVISAEDSPETTIIPRLLAADATLWDHENGDLVHIWRQSGAWSLEDAKKLQEYIYKHGASLVIIDPVAAFGGGRADTYKDSDVRSMLAPIRAIAEDQECTILAVMHLKKGAEAEAVNSVAGSIAWTAAPRSVLMVKRVDDDRSQRVLYHAKCNVGPEQPALLFTVEQVDVGEIGNWTSSFVRWGAEDASLDIQSAFAPPPDKRTQAPSPSLDHALDTLKECLGSGEWTLTGMVNRYCEDEGVKPGALQKAKKKLGIEQEQRGALGHFSRWPAAAGTD